MDVAIAWKAEEGSTRVEYCLPERRVWEIFG